METKRCWKCKQLKPMNDFWNDKSRYDGKCHACKSCMKEYQGDHKEDIKEASKRHYENNKESVLLDHKAWKEINREKLRADAKEYRALNRDALKARELAWYHAHKEEVAPKQRSRWLKKKFGITQEIFDSLLKKQNNKCGVCLLPFTETSKICVDHCHNAGHVRGLLCGKCNSAEGMLGSIENAELLLAYMKKNEIFYPHNGNA